MWFLIKSIAGALLLLTLAYAVFFVDLGGRTFSGHVVDVWESPTIQEKVDLVRNGVRNELEDRLAAAAAQQTREVVRESLGGGHEEITDADRESLAKMIVTD